MTQNQKFILKLFFNIATVGFIVYLLEKQLTWASLVIAFSGLNIPLFAFVTVIFISRNILCSERSHYLYLKLLGLNCNRFDLFYYYLISLTFSLFLPTGVAGDIVRGAYLHSKYQIKKTDLARMLMLERLVGLISTVILSLLGFVVCGNLMHIIPVSSKVVLIIDLIIFFGVVLLLAIYTGRKYLGFSRRWIEMLFPYQSITTFSQLWKISVTTLTYSLVAQLLAIICVVILIQAQAINFPWYYSFFVMPTVWILSVVPMVAVREGVIIYLYHAVGMPLNYAVSFALLYFIMFVIEAIPGGVLQLRLLINKRENNSLYADSAS